MLIVRALGTSSRISSNRFCPSGDVIVPEEAPVEEEASTLTAH
jgi:hypothetical protein